MKHKKAYLFTVVTILLFLAIFISVLQAGRRQPRDIFLSGLDSERMRYLEEDIASDYLELLRIGGIRLQPLAAGINISLDDIYLTNTTADYMQRLAEYNTFLSAYNSLINANTTLTHYSPSFFVGDDAWFAADSSQFDAGANVSSIQGLSILIDANASSASATSSVSGGSVPLDIAVRDSQNNTVMSQSVSIDPYALSTFSVTFNSSAPNPKLDINVGAVGGGAGRLRITATSLDATVHLLSIQLGITEQRYMVYANSTIALSAGNSLRKNGSLVLGEG